MEERNLFTTSEGELIIKERVQLIYGVFLIVQAVSYRVKLIYQIPHRINLIYLSFKFESSRISSSLNSNFN